MSGDNPLDASAVHPEAYPLVERIAGDTGRDVRGLIGDSTFLRKLEPARYTDERFGIPTITDVLRELDKPGRDPRPEFKAAEFQEGVESLKDLKPGMTLEGVVTNVANFGAFVDIGVHQDGLVHISMLSQQFVKDPRDVVKAGDIVKVKVLEVDIPRQRISLTMRMDDKPQPASERTAGERPRGRNNAPRGNGSGNGKPGQASSTGTFANLFANAKNLKKK
ncbi:UNVERIFIED_CONTAM: yhgF [Trichonephila clavipes]